MLQAGPESHGSERRQRSTAATARGVHSALWRYHTGPTTRAFFSPRRLAWACARLASPRPLVTSNNASGSVLRSFVAREALMTPITRTRAARAIPDLPSSYMGKSLSLTKQARRASTGPADLSIAGFSAACRGVSPSSLQPTTTTSTRPKGQRARTSRSVAVNCHLEGGTGSLFRSSVSLLAPSASPYECRAVGRCVAGGCLVASIHVLYRCGNLVKAMSRVSSKNQVTIPVGVLRAAGINAGDEVVIRAAGSGRIEVERADDLVTRFAGSLPAGIYPPGYLDELRDEWRR